MTKPYAIQPTDGCQGCGDGPGDCCTCHMTRDEMVSAGLMEGPNYRDFAPAKDCFPEDWDDHRFDGADRGL